MRLIIYIYIIVLLVCSFVYPGQIILDSDDLKDITSRDSYDLLTKISTIHGLSYGIIGQPVEFERIGKDSKDISLYIDDIYYGKNIADLSFLSVDQVDRIVLDDRSIENSGTALHLYTKSFLIPVPTTEIKYRDAFFNYRNLSVDIFQNVTKDFSFLLSGEIFDWKDKREYSDNFAFPYQKQNYRLKFNFPVMKYTKPTLDISYIKEDKYLLDSDSIYSKPENLRSVLYFDNNLSNTLNNRLVFIHLYEHSRSTSNIFNVYDKISFQDSLRYFETVLGTNIYEENNLTYIKSNFSKKAFINTELNGFFGIDEDSDPKLSAHIDLDKDINSIFELSSSHGYFLDKTENQDPSMELFENSFSLNKDFHFSKWNIKLSSGYDIFNYSNKPDDIADSIDFTSKRDFYKLEFRVDRLNKIRFKNEFIRSTSGKIYDTCYLNNISEISFSDKYFYDKLNVNLSLNHRYSEYFISDKKEFANNLSFNFRAKIVNFEFFFGSDNFLKGHYTINNKLYDVNKHYHYQTVEGFDMRTHDEIWGIRWTFYR